MYYRFTRWLFGNNYVPFETSMVSISWTSPAKHHDIRQLYRQDGTMNHYGLVQGEDFSEKKGYNFYQAFALLIFFVAKYQSNVRFT